MNVTPGHLRHRSGNIHPETHDLSSDSPQPDEPPTIGLNSCSVYVRAADLIAGTDG
jgi:hypothetical protein